ncbi:MAG: uracil-DNA glycosylase [Candidatus Omnitrophica bacterium]|nr:uracil-DNA glycosylase [Candidatus Omnitrophota bacterium]
MGNGKIIIDQLKQNLQQIRLRLEFEEYFSKEGLPFSNAQSINVPAVKKETFEALLARAKKCQLCPLYKTKTNLVFGDGDLNAQIMFVGEAPGRDEDLSGIPFVGVAGELLTRIIKAMRLERGDVFITNVLRCRPPGNRNPLPEEVVCCRPYLIELVKIIKPKIICTLGKFAAHALLDETRPISRLRGNFYDFEGIKLMPTYHPAYLLRNPQDKRLVWDDMQKIMKHLKEDET